MSDRPGRLLDLVHLLAGRRPRKLSELAEELATSQRTIYRDLATLEARRIPLTRDHHGYRLVDSAQLRPLNLTAEERAVLRLALDNPVLRARATLRRSLATLSSKLDAATAALGETPEALALATLDRTGPVDDTVLAGLEGAVGSRRSIEMRYHSLSRPARRLRWRRLDPYRLFHRADAWYVAGHCHRNGELRLFRLDRIAELRPTDDAFEHPADLDTALSALFDHSWAIYRGGGRHHIRLRFDPSLVALLESARHHRGEELQRLVGGALEYRVTLSHLDEIARWIVGFGGKCQVVEPETLREKVEGLARGVLGGERETGDDS
ncbi:MAG TPA: WYL domain-containing protein [Thermoanaerobaculia bacterium]|nr:WYL domain-containing protein [Thermoanaerobaculia bacterium]